MEKDVFLKVYGLDAGYDRKIVVGGVSFELREGEILSLIGPNGAGKSTILKTVSARLDKLAGSVALNGREVSLMELKERARQIAVVLTGGIKTGMLTCREVVESGRYPYTGMLGKLSDKDKEIVEEAMKLAGALKYADRDIERVSDGQRQRVLLACAIAQEPKLILLDEPTSYLDIKGKYEFMDALMRLCKEKKMSAVMSIHELELAEKVSDRILCIKDNKADRYGTPEEVLKKDYIAELFGLNDELIGRFMK
ncbi:MAG: ABC transporter ATP-binding protein [Lachnospiraceae bacterium]|nr:ABC-type cobalamin/Fe3+-siderophores transport system, ATPase component [Lachnospiraceae bacterium XPB1003]